MERRTSLLIVGAGPFGLAMAAHAGHLGIDHLNVGRPMEFWKRHMPAGMLLRSASDWHLDTLGKDTIEAFLAERGQVPNDVEPLSMDLYLRYAAWFGERKSLAPLPRIVERLDTGADPRFVARLDDGSVVRADHVLLALGFRNFAHLPPEIVSILPGGRFSHTCDCIELGAFRGGRCLIVGGRQSALEWAALLAEQGASRVYVSHRHDTPAFISSDWSWVGPLVENMAAHPDWYRRLPEPERRELDARFWREGRLKLEPWLAPRLRNPAIELLPNTRVDSCQVRAEATMAVRLDDGRELSVDHVIFATGYKVDMARVPFLSNSVRAGLRLEAGFPVLDTSMQSSVPGLYVTSLPASRSFGLFFGFTSAARASARIVGDALTG